MNRFFRNKYLKYKTKYMELLLKKGGADESKDNESKDDNEPTDNIWKITDKLSLANAFWIIFSPENEEEIYSDIKNIDYFAKNVYNKDFEELNELLIVSSNSQNPQNYVSKFIEQFASSNCSWNDLVLIIIGDKPPNLDTIVKNIQEAIGAILNNKEIFMSPPKHELDPHEIWFENIEEFKTFYKVIKHGSLPTRIRDDLWISGNKLKVETLTALKDYYKKDLFIVDISSDEIPKYKAATTIDNIKIIKDIVDDERTDLSSTLEKYSSIIKDKIQKNFLVLVHCNQGRNRSASIATAALMLLEPELTADEAIAKTKAGDPAKDILQNKSFCAQLQEFKKKLQKKN